jgi:exonuclease III
MHHTYKIATVNVNGIAIHTKISMLGDFLKRQDIDVTLLQEVTHNDFTTIREYNVIVNEGTD